MARVGAGEVNAGRRGGDVGAGAVQDRPRLDHSHLGRLHLGADFLQGGLGRTQLVPGLVEQAAGLRPRLEELLDATELAPPAHDVSHGAVDSGSDLGEFRLGALDVGGGHLDRGIGLLAPRDGLLDRRLLLPQVGLELGRR